LLKKERRSAVEEYAKLRETRSHEEAMEQLFPLQR
jgi:hypothetical protein